MRAYPALIVLFNHLYLTLYVVDGSENRSWFTSAVFDVVKTGDAAVVMLIVLSGFIVGGALVRAARRTDEWRFDLYALDRLSRLWNVLIPALLLCLLLDTAGMAWFGRDGVYGGHTTGVVFFAVKKFTTAAMFVTNLFFNGKIKTPTFGSNTALWTVAYEFWFYFLGAALVFALLRLRRNSVSRTAVLLAIALVMALYVRGDVLRYFALWCIGAAAGTIPRKRLRAAGSGRVVCLGVGVALLVAALWFGARDVPTYGVRLGSALLTALALPILVSNEAEAEPGPLGRFTIWLASISFSLYAIHVPILVFARGFLEHHDAVPTITTGTVFVGLLPALALVGIASVFARYTEHRLPQMRTRIRRALGQLAPTSS